MKPLSNKKDINQLLLFALVTPSGFSKEQKAGLLKELAKKFDLEITVNAKRRKKA